MRGSDSPLYRLEDLAFFYGERFELHIPKLDIPEGCTIGFIGPNGGGKSTLLKILSFLEHPHQGTILFSGVKVTPDANPFRRQVTILPQEPYLLKRTVFENVAYGLKVRGEKQGIRKKVHEALEQVGLMPGSFTSRSWHELSGGEAQRVALASRLILRPRVLILDEPTTSVDQSSALLIKESINACRRKLNTTLIISSHDHLWLNSVTHDIRKVYQGRIVGFATENLIFGPWKKSTDSLYEKILPDGQVIHAVSPQDAGATAILDPSDIVISTAHPDHLSAQNTLSGIVTQLSIEPFSDTMIMELNCGGQTLLCRITSNAARELNILPGERVWAVFKASSLRWY
ncbi:MAG TPA: ATP-binding cassette domain-containing protein [Deltaproteobacteria bacterium]|nr:ATP-binding cassette domain-containing protein [Deltaproteobacteria bacterium]